MNVLVVDNYDSFTYNLSDYLGVLGATISVVRNDSSFDDLRYDAAVISPGPGGPDEAGISTSVVERCAADGLPLLGVCLGHQVIGAVFGARIVRAPRVMHGKTSTVHHNGRGVLRDLPDPFEAMRYHSLVVDLGSLPAELIVDAWTEDGLVMAMSHSELAIYGVQFHPESILTPDGMTVLSNFLVVARAVSANCSNRRIS